jgi:uncharacterized protein
MNLHRAFFLISKLACLLLLLIHPVVLALEVPPLRGRVNDYASMIPADKARQLEERLARFESETGHQVAVLTIPSLEGDPIEDFSIRVAEAWKIGQKGFDNGAILLIAQKDRKLRIEVGYGLEGVLPDAIANRIIGEVIVPRFRENDYAGGIEAGVAAILQVTKGEALPEARRSRGQTARVSSLATVLIMTAVLALIIGMTQRRFAGGALGGAGAGFAATLVSSAGLGMGLILALIIGAVLGAIGSSMAAVSPSRQWTGGSRHRRGGWGSGVFPGGFGGGGFGGGGFGGGGFSGGGGGFGGGGASGSW